MTMKSTPMSSHRQPHRHTSITSASSRNGSRGSERIAPWTVLFPWRSALAVTILILLSQPVQGSFICLLFGARQCFLGTIMHRGTPGTPDCEEVCAFFLFAILNFFSGYGCGGCTEDDGLLIPQENDPNSFGLDVFGVNVPSADAGAFVAAANRWNSIITADRQGPYTFQELTDVQPADELMNGCRYPSNGVDDLLICADIRSIDGSGTVLGAAAPGLTDSATGLPVTGFMFFDSADIALLKRQGLYETVILHEMGHVLGIGTLWLAKGVQTNSNTCPYNGANANDEYKRLTNCSNNALTEQNGNAGSKCSHWKENSCLGNELMSSALSANSRLTSITIGSLEDIGYAVDYSRNQDTTLSQNGCCRRRGLTAESLPPPFRRRQLLSDAGVAAAVAFGQQILTAQSERASSRGAGTDHLFGAVSVLMLENDEIFEVLVNSDGVVDV